jgi:protocatechuate 3,4-dioxygenase beta subunit
MCTLTPELTEGPYYLDGEAVRRDITDGQPGIPLRLNLTVVDAAACAPIANASVDVWHANASGDYSGFGNAASNRTFLRGTQVSGADGVATFDTIYPGWYQGRATHIHLKVHVGGSVVHTGQLFFDEAANATIYTQAPYNGHTGNRTTNGEDGIFGQAGSSALVRLTPDGAGFVGAMTLAVKTTGTANPVP